MGSIATEILIVLALLVLNGVFAMSELAIVTARKVRLEQRAEDGDAGARAALALAQDPTQFLSTVQVGITLIGVLAGAFGGATIADELALGLARVSAIAPYADAVALAIVVTALTYLSLLIGELVPKRVALSQPERVASLVARPMRALSRVAAPLVALLTGPTNLLLRLFGIRVSTEPSITVQEIRALIEQGAEIGAVEGSEHEMVEGVFRLGDRHVADVMTPRTRIEWIDVSEPPDSIRAQIVEQATARYLMCDGEIDNVVGVAHAEDLLVRCLQGAPFDVRPVLWQPLYVPAAMTALDLLEQFRKSRQYVAIALDEFGGLQGVVMLDDLVEAVLGELPGRGESTVPSIERRDDHTWAIQGSVSLEDVETTLDLSEIPDDTRRGVRTLGGFVMTMLGRVPVVGDVVEWDGLRARVDAMDGRRIDRVIVTKLGRRDGSEPPSNPDAEAPADQ
jgi:putative hemolysin